MYIYYEGILYNHALCCFRSLGVHVSKVRSLILDAWEPEQVKVRLGKHWETVTTNSNLTILEGGVRRGDCVIGDRPELSFL